jgi:hypothetical protein
MYRIAEGYVPAGTMEGALQKIKKLGNDKI